MKYYPEVILEDILSFTYCMEIQSVAMYRIDTYPFESLGHDKLNSVKLVKSIHVKNPEKIVV